MGAPDSTAVDGERRVTIEVRGNLPALETSQHTVTRIVQTDEIDAVPVINRNFNDLAALVPGVTKTGVYGGVDVSGGRDFQNAYPCLILMDLQLPRMDGLELTRRLKADPARCQIIIIALTGYAMKGDERKAFAAGCDDYMSKPIDIDALPRMVAEHLVRRASPGAER